MSQCSANDLLSSSATFAGLPASQLQVLQTALLIQLVKQANPMANCTVSALLQDAACFANLPAQMLATVQTQLLCELLNSGGGGGSSCILCGNADPVADSPCDCALYYRKDTLAVWLWNSGTNHWDEVLA